MRSSSSGISALPTGIAVLGLIAALILMPPAPVDLGPTPLPAMILPPSPSMSSSPVRPPLSPVRPLLIPTLARWPGPTNTGVPDGVQLTAYTGPCTITTAGTVIDGKAVDCDLVIAAENVLITRSRINGEINGGQGTGSSFRVQDSEIVNGKRDACQCVGSDNFIALRVEIKGGNRGVYCRLNCIVQDSWIHGTDLLPLQHASAIRVEQHSIVRHNTLACDWTAISDSEIGCSADMTGYPDFAPIHDNRIERNLFVANARGLGYCAYGGTSRHKVHSNDPVNATYIAFIGNVFQRGRSRRCGTWGPIADFDPTRTGNKWSGNTWDTGETVRPR